VSAPQPPAKPQSLSVDAIHDSPPSRVDPEVDAAVGGERADLESERLKAQIALLKAEVQDRDQDREERVKYANRVFRLLLVWLLWMGAVVVAQGVGPLPFHLAEAVIIALVGGTTASVIGIFLIVANYLFPRGPRSKP